MPLINMVVLCGGEAPVVVSVCDCTDHMVDGKKKDAEFIGIFFKDKAEEWDPSHHYTDCFSLMEQQMSKKMETFCAQITPYHYAFMVECM